jgi:asparagine synthase (glutamine-hydrolysing)
MSGVFGVIDPARKINIHALTKKMAETMSHREWFVTDQFVDEEQNLALGRIGIDIFNRERQPVCNEAKSMYIFMSGEVYNSAELRKDFKLRGCHFRDETGPELVLQLYQKIGIRTINLLEGVFVIAIWDRTQNKVVIVNDRLGMNPLYYAHFNRRFIFAPEMKSVLVDPDFIKKIDYTGLAEYMRFQHLLGDKTFFEGLKLMPNASCLTFDIELDQLTVESYWDFSHISPLPATLTFEDAVDEAGWLLQRSVDNMTASSHRYGVFLTGGMDSRLILGLMRHNPKSVSTFTFGQKSSRDVVRAQKIATKIGTDHHYFEFIDGKWVKDYADLHLELTEGYHSWIHSHGISILDLVRSFTDVNLSGFGGSEINWEKPAVLHASDDLTFLIQIYNSLLNDTTWPSLDDVEEKLLYSSRIRRDLQGLAFESLRSELTKFSHLSYVQRAASFSRLNPDRRLFQHHTTFHRAYFEERFPFCDYRYVEFIYALPPEMLFNRKLRRSVILKFAHSVANIPYDKDDLPITQSKSLRLFLNLMRRGAAYVNRHVGHFYTEYTPFYADYENWLRNELREWAEDVLFGERTLQRNIFNQDFLKSLWQRHLSGHEKWTIGKIAPLITYEMMLRRFYD